MKIWYGMILVATIILAGYLVIVVSSYAPLLREAQADMKMLLKRIDAQNELLNALQADIKKLGKENNAAPPKPAQQDVGKIAIDSLRNSLNQLKEADTKKQQGDISSAIDILKSAKTAVWKAGDGLTAHQVALRALMGPMDTIMNKWKQGDKVADTSQVAIGIRTVLEKIDSKVE